MWLNVSRARVALWLLAGLVTAKAAEPANTPAPPPKLQTNTVFLAEIRCSACVSLLEQTIRQVPGVASVEEFTEFSGYARVAFDPRQTGHQQIAQAVAEAFPIHGEPFAATLKLSIPDYSRPENTARVDALLARQKEWVAVECKNREKGLFVIRFKPLVLKADQRGAQGWAADAFLLALRAPAPQGLGLHAQWVELP